MDRDGEHAVVDRSEMPGLTYVTHNNGNSTWGVTGPSADPAAIVLANQSQAYTTVGYSLLRYDLTMIREFARYETLYTQSKWRLYPEHTDCGVEDMFPFMTPVWLASQGSSGSELDEGRRFCGLLQFPLRLRAHRAHFAARFPQPVNRAGDFRLRHLAGGATQLIPAAGINDEHAAVGGLEDIGGMEVGMIAGEEVAVLRLPGGAERF